MGGMVEKIETVLREHIAKVIGQFQSIDNHGFASQRTTADQIEHGARTLLLETDPGFQPPTGPRQPGDIRFVADHTFHINIKSLDLDKDFHMPNLISSENLWKILDQGDEFMILKFKHRAGEIQDWQLWNIQDIDWACLQISALGTGQLQFKDGLADVQSHQGSREEWRRQWRENMLKFYEREKTKIDKRLTKWQKR